MPWRCEGTGARRGAACFDAAISSAGPPSPYDDGALSSAGTTRAGFVRGAAGLVLLGAVGLEGLLADDASGAALRSPDDVRTFRSRPDLRPPRLTVLKAGADPDRLLFMAPSSGPGRRGVLIADNNGEPIWFRETNPATAMNFRTALYKGEPVLTWWEGKAERGLGVGVHVIVDSSYRELARFPAGAGRQSDLHEFTLTPRGTAIIASYEVRDADLRSVGGGSRSKVVGSIVQEIAIPSARVLFSWRSLDHVAVEESYTSFNGMSHDYFHINSIDVDADGHLLVSARNTWAVYKVHGGTGQVLWRLGGRRSSFRMGPGTSFAWQHDARHHDEGRLISIFDNSAAPPVGPQSRALLIELDRRGRNATLVRQYTHPRRLLSPFMGNAQRLPNGNVVVGWGGLPYVTEFDAGGGVHFDARLPAGGQNYRAFRFPWVGRPTEPPRLVLGEVGGGRRLFVSWNGATEVASWRFETGRREGALAPLGTRPRKGFETSLPIKPGHGFAQALALDAKGRVLGRSKAIRI